MLFQYPNSVQCVNFIVIFIPKNWIKMKARNWVDAQVFVEGLRVAFMEVLRRAI